MDISCVYASAPIDEVDAPGIAIGMPVRIALDAFPERRFDGRVRRIAPYVLDREKQARTVDVEVDFDVPAECDCLLPGYSADIEIILQARPEVLRIPTEAILEGNKVYLLTADNLLASRSITAGLTNWSWTEVTEGLRQGDRIVTSVDREGVEAGAPATPEGSGGND
jgi:HlyD family secretion protein